MIGVLGGVGPQGVDSRMIAGILVLEVSVVVRVAREVAWQADLEISTCDLDGNIDQGS
jgi:hypothetical protein